MPLLILQAVTPLCVGQGTAVGSTKLPLARERHSKWPFVPGSSLKGALRARAERLGVDPAQIVKTFGATPGDADDHHDQRGALVFNQATLLALPLRSLQGCFMLVSCPMALARIARELQDPPEIPQVAIDRVLVAPDQLNTFNADSRQGLMADAPEGVAIVEDLDLVVAKDTRVEKWAARFSSTVGGGIPLKHLAIVHDQVFDHACAAWTPVRTRAAIDPVSSVVKQGQLFTQESLPPETLLWTCLEAQVHPPDHLVYESLLPAQGRTFSVGGSQTLGAGRLVWHAMEAS